MLFRLSKTRKITENVFVVKTLVSNFFIYSNNGTFICFNTGFIPFIIHKELRKININPESISDIFLTDADFKNTGGIKIFKNANIYVSKNIPSRKAGKLFPRIENSCNIKCVRLDDGDIVKTGGIKVKSIVIPNHKKNSISYIVNNSILFI